MLGYVRGEALGVLLSRIIGQEMNTSRERRTIVLQVMEAWRKRPMGFTWSRFSWEEFRVAVTTENPAGARPAEKELIIMTD